MILSIFKNPLRSKSLLVITILLLAAVNISLAQVTRVWQPTTGSANWNVGGNWLPVGVPAAIDIAVFNQGNSTCVLPVGPNTITIAGLSFTGTFTGSLDLNSGTGAVNTLQVLASGSTTLSTGNIINSNVSGVFGTLQITSSSPNSVSITGITAGARTNLNILAPNNITLSGNTSNGSVTIEKTGATNYTHLANPNTFVGALTIRNSGTGEFIYKNDVINAPATLFLDNASTGILRLESVTANGNLNLKQLNNGQMYLGSATENFTLGRFMQVGGPNFNNGSLTLRNFVQQDPTFSQNVTFTGSAIVSLLDGTIFNGTVTFSAPSFNNIVNTVFNGSNTILTKTGPSPDSWTGGNTYKGAVINANAGTLQFPITTPDTFNGNLLLTQNAGILNACYSANCVLAGNLTVNRSTVGVYTFGNGTASSGALEFISANPQTVSKGGSVTSLAAPYIILNKSLSEVVTVTNTNIQVTSLATMTNGIINVGSNTITFNDPSPSSIIGYGSTSFVDGVVQYVSAIGSVTFPTGTVVGKAYRPLTLNFTQPTPLNNISARYFKSAAPAGPLDPALSNVSAFEYWSVNALTSFDFTATLSWNNNNTFNPNYITDVSKLRVSRFGVSWQDNGVSSVNPFGPFSPLTPPQAGTITSNPINVGATNIGNVTLGSTDAAANPLSMGVPKFRWRPTVADPTYRWTNGANWEAGSVPTATDIAIFDLGSTTCVLPLGSPFPLSVTVGGIEMSPPFTGAIDLNGSNLFVSTTWPSVLTSGTITSTQPISAVGFSLSANTSVSVSGINTSGLAKFQINESVSGVGVSVSSCVFNGSGGFLVTAPDGIVLNNNAFNSLTTVAITGATLFTFASGTNTFSSGPSLTLRNQGTGLFNYANETLSRPLILNNTSTGTLSTDLVTSTNLTVSNNTGTINIDRHTANGNSTINNSTGTILIDRTTFNGNVNLNNNSTGTLRVDRGSATGIVSVSQLFNGQMYVGSASGSFTLQPNATITATAGGFKNGNLYLKNFVQLGSIPQSATFGGSAKVNLQDGTIFNGPLTLAAPSLDIFNTVFNGNATITKTAAFTTDSWTGGNTYNANTIFIANAGILRFPTTNPDVFNHLTLTQNGGTINACYSANCLIAGDLTVNGSTAGVYTFGNGLATSGTLEFTGAAHQTVNIVAPVTSLSVPKITLNKSVDETVTVNTSIDVTATPGVSAVFTKGILALPGTTNVATSNVITFKTPASITGFGPSSFIDGWMRYGSCSIGVGITFPTGDAPDKIYRPITITSAPTENPANLNNISARYFNGGTPSPLSVASPPTNVSTFESWSVNATPTKPFFATLSWRNPDVGVDYVGSADMLSKKLIVSRFDYVSTNKWQDNGVSAVNSFGPFSPLAPPDAGTITSTAITLTGLGTNIGNLTLGSTDPVLNPLKRNPKICRWRPTVGGPNFPWNDPNNWDITYVPGKFDIAIFDLGNTTCVLPAASVTVSGLDLSGTFTGNINPNGVSLNVKAIGPTVLSSAAKIIGSGSVVIDGNGFPVSVSNLSNAVGTTLDVTSDNLTVSSNVFNGSFMGSSSSCIGLTNVTFNGPTTFTKTGGSPCTFALGGSTLPSGGPTVTFRNSGAGQLTVSNMTFNTPLVFDNTNNGTFTIDNNTANSNATFSNAASGTFNAGFTSNIRLGGNLTTNGVVTFGNGLASSGAVEFIGSTPQTIGSFTLFSIGPSLISFSKMILNKSATETVTTNANVNVNVSGTFINGILVTPGTVTFGVGSSASVLSNKSFVNGTVFRTALSGTFGAFTYPTGAISGAAKIGRPITITLSSAPNETLDLSARYFYATTPFSGNINGVTNVATKEYWFLGDGRPTQPFLAALSWNNADFNPGYITDVTKLRVSRYEDWSNLNWQDEGNSGIAPFPGLPAPPAAGIITSAPINLNNAAFLYVGYLTLGSVNALLNPLPIELREFSGEFTPEGVVRLDFETATEVNNDHFEIERADNELDFVKIGSVPGHGTTHDQHTYSWIDQSPLSGVSYYRLRQVDFDGQSTYSKIISVRSENENSEFSVYPNPATSNDDLIFSRTDDVVVYDFNGKIVAKARGVREINLKGYNPGIYVVKARNGETKRFVVK